MGQLKSHLNLRWAILKLVLRKHWGFIPAFIILAAVNTHKYGARGGIACLLLWYVVFEQTVASILKRHEKEQLREDIIKFLKGASEIDYIPVRLS